MPYKREYHKLVCPKCGREYEVLTQAYKRKMKDEKYGMLCASCRAKVQMEEMTPEQRAELRRKAHDAYRKAYENMSDEKKAELKAKRTAGTKKMWAEMSEEERKAKSEKRSTDRKNKVASWTDEDRAEIGRKISEAKKEKISNMSEEEYQAYFEKASAAHKEAWVNMSDESRANILKTLQDNANAYKLKWESMTEEERDEIREVMSQRRRAAWDSLSDEEKERRRNILREQGVAAWNSLTPEERQARIENIKYHYSLWLTDPENRKSISDRALRTWNNKTDEQKAENIEKMTNASKEWWNNLTPEERAIDSERRVSNFKKFWSNASEEEKAKINGAISDSVKKFWEESSDEYKNSIRERLIRIANEYRESMSEEDKQEWARKSSENVKRYWENLTPEDREAKVAYSIQKHDEFLNSLTEHERREFYARIFESASYPNKTNVLFEKEFNECDLLKGYKFVPEYKVRGPGFYHRWDYVIINRDDRIVAVVDLDGIFYHADKYDYDGTHSVEKIDSRRWMTVPDEVKVFIITGNDQRAGFDRMVNLISLPYSEYIDKLFIECRTIPFPVPSYSQPTLLRMWERFKKFDASIYADYPVDDKKGAKIIEHFHPSIYRAHMKGNISPFDVWHNDNMLKEAIKKHTIFQSYLNKNKMLQGFNVASVGTRVSVKSPALIKSMLYHYSSSFDEIFDPFMGFGEIMLATLGSNKRFIGQDISDISYKENTDMLEFLRDHGDIDASISICDSSITTGDYECLFTCVPSGNEEYLDVRPDGRSSDDWIDICLKNYKCKRYVFIVETTEKYKRDEFIDSSFHDYCPPGHEDSYVIIIDEP